MSWWIFIWSCRHLCIAVCDCIVIMQACLYVYWVCVSHGILIYCHDLWSMIRGYYCIVVTTLIYNNRITCRGWSCIDHAIMSRTSSRTKVNTIEAVCATLSDQAKEASSPTALILVVWSTDKRASKMAKEKTNRIISLDEKIGNAKIIWNWRDRIEN